MGDGISGFVVRSTGAFSKLGSFARSPKIAIHISLKGSFIELPKGILAVGRRDCRSGLNAGLKGKS